MASHKVQSQGHCYFYFILMTYTKQWCTVLYVVVKMIQISSLQINSLKKNINYDLKHFCQQIRSNRLSLNGDKTKIIIFRNSYQQINKKRNFRLNREKLIQISALKYLGVHLAHTPTWNTYPLELLPKLNRTVGLLSKIRHYTPKSLVRTIYYFLFTSYLVYVCQTCRQSKTELFNKIQELQDKALRIRRPQKL